MELISSKIKSGIKWQFVSNILGQSIYFINGIALARILSPREFGIFGMVQIISSFIFMFWNLGINAAIIQKKEINDKLTNTAFILCIFMGVACFLIISLIAPLIASFFKEQAVHSLSILVGLTFIIYSFDRMPSALLSKNLKFKELSIIELINPFVQLIVTVPLALHGFGPFSFAWGIIVAAFFIMLMKIYVGRKLVGWNPKLEFSFNHAKQLFHFGSFMTLHSLMNFLFLNLQKIFAGKLFGATDLGYFNRASNLSILPMSQVRGNVESVLLPAFSKVQDSREKIKDWFKKFNYFTYAIISPPLVFFIFYSKEIIIGIFGYKWGPAAPLLVWTSLSCLFSAPEIFFSSILNSLGKPKVNFLVKLFVLVPFVLAILFGSNWGIYGLAVALFISAITVLITYLVVFSVYGLLSINEFLTTSFEPILAAIVSIFITKLIYLHLQRYVNNAVLEIAVLLIIFGSLELFYYAYRWFAASHIKYLGFNIRHVLEFKKV